MTCRTYYQNNATITVYSRLPTRVMPSYWTQHELTQADINMVVSYLPAIMIWQCVLLHGGMVPWFNMRASSATQYSIALSSKTNALGTLQKIVDYPCTWTTNKLELESVESI